MFLMKNSRGRPDFLMSAAVLTLGAVLARFLATGVTVGKFAIGPLDAGLVAALLTPTFGAYVAKRVAAKENP